MFSPAKSEIFRRRFLRAIPAILLAIAATYALNLFGILSSLERYVLDLELTGKSACSEASGDPTCPIALVIISNADYANIFDGRSPLKADRLHDVIASIAAQDPHVIAVDIDTSHPQFQTFNPQFKASNGKLIPIIWEREVTASGRKDTQEFHPLDVLGAQNPRLNRSSGIPMLFDDSTKLLAIICAASRPPSEKFLLSFMRWRMLTDLPSIRTAPFAQMVPICVCA
jgi:hypothetical protein